jgi:hypothetical protein
MDPFAAPVEDMGIEHRRATIPVPEPFRKRLDVVAVFQQVRGECAPLTPSSVLTPYLCHTRLCWRQTTSGSTKAEQWFEIRPVSGGHGVTLHVGTCCRRRKHHGGALGGVIISSQQNQGVLKARQSPQPHSHQVERPGRTPSQYGRQR